MKVLKQKAILTAAVVITSLTITTVAFAAGSVNESSGSRVNAGLVSNEACMSAKDSIMLSYSSPIYDKTVQQYVVDGVSLARIDSSCEGQTISITIRDGSETVIAETSGTITGSSYSVTFEPVNAEAVNDAAIVIYGD